MNWNRSRSCRSEAAGAGFSTITYCSPPPLNQQEKHCKDSNYSESPPCYMHYNLSKSYKVANSVFLFLLHLTQTTFAPKTDSLFTFLAQVHSNLIFFLMPKSFCFLHVYICRRFLPSFIHNGSFTLVGFLANVCMFSKYEASLSTHPNMFNNIHQTNYLTSPENQID